MEVNKDIAKLFIEFLANQGITIEFKMELDPLFDTTEEYLHFAKKFEMLDNQLISQAFPWKDSKTLDHDTWKHHNKMWLKLLEYRNEGL